MHNLKNKAKNFNVYLFCGFWQDIRYLFYYGLCESLSKLSEFFLIRLFDYACLKIQRFCLFIIEEQLNIVI
jgi:hypothetical protein